MILIKNGVVIDPKTKTEEKKDIAIKDGVIVKLCEDIDVQTLSQLWNVAAEQIEVIDATDKLIGPGLVDVHVHFRDPGFTYKEDILTGSEAAKKGGFTTVVLMANTKPAVDTVETLEYVLKKGKETGIRVESCACITMGLKGEVLTDMTALYKAGAAGFTDDGIPILKEDMVRAAMEQAVLLSKEVNAPIPLSFHEENPEFITNNGINRGKASEHFGIGGSDRQAEINLVERDLKLAMETGACFNVQHISTKEAVDLVREAKQKGYTEIHAEATPHHIMLTEEAAIKYGTLAKMNPPLRTEEDRRAVIAGIMDGTIDMIATDHAPHSKEEKEKEITEAPSGIIGLETAFACVITELAKKNQMSLVDVFDRMSYAPAKMYGFDRGYIAEGAVADLIVFNTSEEQTFDTFVSKSGNTPFRGAKMYGKIEKTICGGIVIYRAK